MFLSLKMSHSFIRSCCWITQQVSHIIKDERLASKMEGKTNISRCLRQFDGLTWLTPTPIFYDRPTPLVIRATCVCCYCISTAVWPVSDECGLSRQVNSQAGVASPVFPISQPVGHSGSNSQSPVWQRTTLNSFWVSFVGVACFVQAVMRCGHTFNIDEMSTQWCSFQIQYLCQIC